jgi:fibro-slime domain-containing protein
LWRIGNFTNSLYATSVKFLSSPHLSFLPERAQSRAFVLALLPLGAIIAAACGGDGGTVLPDQPPPDPTGMTTTSSGSGMSFVDPDAATEDRIVPGSSSGVMTDGAVTLLDATTVVCGDGKLGGQEECDDGNAQSADGCSSMCKAEPNFRCATPGKACVSTVVCGDKQVTGPESCDDGNLTALDGCSATCAVESGWTCPFPGAACIPAKCGDGLTRGDEECDDNNGVSGDGCSSSCRLEEGFKCVGATCTKTVCGDGKIEGTEQCDDGNLRPFDGCDTTCKREPSCTVGQGCSAVCGDGLKFPGEACDDGNTRDGDGCSSTCAIEPGFTCAVQKEPLPAAIKVPIIYRDFKGADLGGNADFEAAWACGKITTNLVRNTLDAQGRPVGIATNRTTAGTPAVDFPVVNPPLTTTGSCTNQQYSSLGSPNFWFTDPPAAPGPSDARQVISTLTLKKQADGSYLFDSLFDNPDGTANPLSPKGGFYPLERLGWQDPSVPAAERESLTAHKTAVTAGANARNFSFTSQLRFWFTYEAGAAVPPRLDFSGDDDVWVFINGQLAVDIGGMHGRELGSVTLDAAKAAAFGLMNGNIYEISVFQAERHTDDSNYKLTLRGFVKQRSYCSPVCGDGIKTPNEVCDDGNKNDTMSPAGYGKCAKDCKTRGGYCGDAVVQTSGGEVCDDGVNLGLYNGCAPGCKRGPYCGDGIAQPQFGEFCDDGVNAGGYGKCAKGCKAGPRCGDGILQSNFGEACDDGNNIDGDGCNARCGRETASSSGIN